MIERYSNIGNGLKLGGVDYVQAADGVDTYHDRQYTFELLIKIPPSLPACWLAFANIGGAFVGLGFIRTTQLGFGFADIARINMVDESPILGSTVHLVGTKSGADWNPVNFLLYVNGQVVPTVVVKDDPVDYNIDRTIGVVELNTFTTKPAFTYYRMRVWEGLATPNEVEQLYKGEDVGLSNLLLHYDFEETSGSTVFDSSNNDFHGTIFGKPSTDYGAIDCRVDGKGEVAL